MINTEKSLALLRQLRDSLENNQGITAEECEKALATLDHAIEALDCSRATGKLMKTDKLLVLLGKVFKVLPSIIDLINKHWH